MAVLAARAQMEALEGVLAAPRHDSDAPSRQFAVSGR